ncbi:MAG: MaoC family dehydratase [Deltaproteobacteria bacterium]|nr:MaoC family dehydratase [Deltaproteobacteria bacterium]
MITIDPALLGKEVPVGDFLVTEENIRAFAAATGDDDLLCTDSDAARQAGYPSCIAPPLFGMKIRGVLALPEAELAPGLVSLNAGLEFEYHDEIYAGQTYAVSVKITDVYEKTGRSGPLGVFVREMLVRDTTGQLVLLMRERRMVRSPDKKI